MRNSPKLAVLITYHNEKELLTQCLEDLIQHTSQVDEIIIFDDASRYPAADYIPSAAAARVIRSENSKGPSAARNLLAAATTCEYIHFHDSGDRFEKNWSEQVKRLIVNENPDLILTEFTGFHEFGERPPKECGLGLRQFTHSILELAITGSIPPLCSTLRREPYLKLGGYLESFDAPEDYEFHIRFILNTSKNSLCFESLVRKMTRAQSASARSGERVAICGLTALESLDKCFPRSCWPGVSRRALAFARHFYRRGNKEAGDRALNLSRKFCLNWRKADQRAFRALSRVVGGERAERVSALLNYFD